MTLGSLFERKIILVNFSFAILFWSFEKWISDSIESSASVFLYVLFITQLLYFNIRYQRSKKLSSQVKELLGNVGFQITSERPLSFVESLRFGITLSAGSIGGMPIEFFTIKGSNLRAFKAIKLDSGNEYELYCDIMKSWSNKLHVDILKKDRLNW